MKKPIKILMFGLLLTMLLILFFSFSSKKHLFGKQIKGHDERTISTKNKTISHHITANKHHLVKIFSKKTVNKETKNTLTRLLGHGILLNQNEYILTNKHILPNDHTSLLYIQQKNKTYPVQHIRREKDNDLAIIKINTAIKKTNTIQRRQTLPQNKIQIRSITTEKTQKGEAFLQSGMYITTTIGKPGESGSILMDKQGHIIGINTFIDTTKKNTLGAIPLSQDMIQKIFTLTH